MQCSYKVKAQKCYKKLIYCGKIIIYLNYEYIFFKKISAID